MEHLFSSRVKVQRKQAVVIDGKPTLSLVDQPAPLDNFKCRLDLLFVRQNKDVPAPVVAGRAPDRSGVMFYSFKIPLKAGDTVVTISGPVTGTFEVKAIPDSAQDSKSAHHMEVQVFESNQTTAGLVPPIMEA